MSGSRPIPAGQGYYPISIVKASCNPVDCPVFGEQFDIITESQWPIAANDFVFFKNPDIGC